MELHCAFVCRIDAGELQVGLPDALADGNDENAE
jgi:hypothetical protein